MMQHEIPQLQAESREHYYIGLRELSSRVRLSRRSIRTYTNAPVDPLPSYRVGNKLLFKWSEVEAWINRRRVKVLDVGAITESFMKKVQP